MLMCIYIYTSILYDGEDEYVNEFDVVEYEESVELEHCTQLCEAQQPEDMLSKTQICC